MGRVFMGREGVHRGIVSSLCLGTPDGRHRGGNAASQMPFCDFNIADSARVSSVALDDSALSRHFRRSASVSFI